MENAITDGHLRHLGLKASDVYYNEHGECILKDKTEPWIGRLYSYKRINGKKFPYFIFLVRDVVKNLSDSKERYAIVETYVQRKGKLYRKFSLSELSVVNISELCDNEKYSRIQNTSVIID